MLKLTTKNIFFILVVFFAYFIPAKLSFLVALYPDNATAVWPASGIAAACVVFFGYMTLPGVFLGSLLANLTNFLLINELFTRQVFDFLDTTSFIAIGATIESFAVAFIIKKIIGYPNSLSHWKDILILFIIAGMIGSIPSPTIGVTTLYLKGFIPLNNYFHNWWTWWIGNSLGIIVCTPILITIFTPAEYISFKRKILIATPLISVLTIIMIIFTNASTWEHKKLEQEFKNEVNNATIQLSNKINSYVDNITTISNFYFTHNYSNRENFRYLINKFFNYDHEMYGFIWAPKIHAELKDKFIERVRKKEVANYSIKNFSKQKKTLFPIYYFESNQIKANNLGYDIYSDNTLSKYIDIAISTGNSQVSKFIQLSALFNSDKILAIFNPVFENGIIYNSAKDRHEHIKGITIGFFQFEKLFNEFTKKLQKNGIEIVIFEPSDTQSEKITLFKSSNKNIPYSLKIDDTIDLGNKNLHVTFQKTTEYLVANKEWYLWYLLLAGLLFAAISAVLTMVITGYSEDIEKVVRKKTNDLHESETRFQLAVEAARDGIWDWSNIKKDIVYWSPQFFKLLGYKNNEIESSYKKFITLLHPNDLLKFKNALENHFAHQETFDIECRLMHKTGIYKWFQTKGLLTVNPDTGIKRMNGSISDISERKNTERKLRKAKDEAISANKMKSEFLATMSHEIRTPMNGIIGITELILDTKLTNQQKHYLNNVLSSAEHLLEILNDILDFSKMEAGQMELEMIPFDLKKTIKGVVDLFAPKAIKKGLQITTKFQKNINKPLIGDSIRISQVLHNLIGNAIKFTESGQIIVNVANQPNYVAPEGKMMIVISIKDTGIGLTEEQKKMIFNKFTQADSSTTRKFGGTGLGLAICQMIVHLLGGKIIVESKIGEGSTFTFNMLLGISSQEISSTDNNNKNISITTDKVSKNIRILMVEDNRLNSELAKEMLKKLKCEVILAKNGLEAVNIVKKDHNLDLIFMDCQMPVMDGFEATNKIIKLEKATNKKHTPIIALTANSMKGDKEKCIAAGMDDYLSKPVRQNDFTKMVLKWTKNRG